MKEKRKILIAMLTALGVAGLSVGGAYAYFTANEAHTNALSYGDNITEIQESFPPATTPPDKTAEPGATPDSTPNPDTNPDAAMAYPKVVTVKNTGDVDCYVRVWMDVDDDSIRRISSISNDGTNWYAFDDYKNHLPTDWIYVKDGNMGGYYYYKKALKPGESTSSLMSQVKTDFYTRSSLAKVNNQYIKPYNILVREESVQTYDKHGTLFTGNDAYQKAWMEFITGDANAE